MPTATVIDRSLSEPVVRPRPHLLVPAAALLGGWVAIGGERGWRQMAILALSIFYALKWLSWRRTPRLATAQPIGRTLGYFFVWPGMDARRFFARPARPAPVTDGQWLRAAGKTLLGAALVWGAARIVLGVSPWAAGWVGAVGLALLLHFGAFEMLSLAWRRGGVDAPPIMNRPARSASLGEFWARRWNIAASQLAHEFVYRPAVRRCGPRAALAASFLVSGAIHDLVISLPAGGGYGLPTAYFLIQAGGLLIEHSRLGRRLRLNRGRVGRFYAWAVVIGPCVILFHPQFMRRVMLPLLAAIGGLPAGG